MDPHLPSTSDAVVPAPDDATAASPAADTMAHSLASAVAQPPTSRLSCDCPLQPCEHHAFVFARDQSTDSTTMHRALLNIPTQALDMLLALPDNGDGSAGAAATNAHAAGCTTPSQAQLRNDGVQQQMPQQQMQRQQQLMQHQQHHHQQPSAQQHLAQQLQLLRREKEDLARRCEAQALQLEQHRDHAPDVMAAADASASDPAPGQKRKKTAEKTLGPRDAAFIKSIFEPAAAVRACFACQTAWKQSPVPFLCGQLSQSGCADKYLNPKIRPGRSSTTWGHILVKMTTAIPKSDWERDPIFAFQQYLKRVHLGITDYLKQKAQEKESKEKAARKDKPSSTAAAKRRRGSDGAVDGTDAKATPEPKARKGRVRVDYGSIARAAQFVCWRSKLIDFPASYRVAHAWFLCHRKTTVSDSASVFTINKICSEDGHFKPVPWLEFDEQLRQDICRRYPTAKFSADGQGIRVEFPASDCTTVEFSKSAGRSQPEQANQLANNFRDDVVKVSKEDGFALSDLPVPKHHCRHLERILIPKGQLLDRIKLLAHRIMRDMQALEMDEPLFLLCVLKGGFQFFSALKQHMQDINETAVDPIQLEFGYVCIQSYRDGTRLSHPLVSGEDVFQELKGKSVVVVESIVQSGKTLGIIEDGLKSMELRRLRTVSLMLQTQGFVSVRRPNYVGFDMPEGTLVGFSLNLDERFNDLEHVCLAKPSASQPEPPQVVPQDSPAGDASPPSKPIKISDTYGRQGTSFQLPNCYLKSIDRILVTRGLILNRVQQMAAEIMEYYTTTKHSVQGLPLVCVCVIKGGQQFFADLLNCFREMNATREMPLRFEENFVRCESYRGAERSTTMMLGIGYEDFRHKHVLIVEDVWDTGHTIADLTKELKKYSLASLNVTCLLTKRTAKSKAETDTEPKWVGFDVPNEFVVGYGLDHNQKFRDLNHLCVWKG